MSLLPVADIDTGERYRKDMGDLPALAVALGVAFHEAGWCKWSDPGHAVAHDESDEDRYRANLAEAILSALPDGWVLARREDAEDGAVVEEAAIAKALTYLRRQVEVMGEDGECSVRRISGREYVTKDDVLLLVDERLGFALFITDTAAARKATVRRWTGGDAA